MPKLFLREPLEPIPVPRTAAARSLPECLRRSFARPPRCPYPWPYPLRFCASVPLALPEGLAKSGSLGFGNDQRELTPLYTPSSLAEPVEPSIAHRVDAARGRSGRVGTAEGLCGSRVTAFPPPNSPASKAHRSGGFKNRCARLRIAHRAGPPTFSQLRRPVPKSGSGGRFRSPAPGAGSEVRLRRTAPKSGSGGRLRSPAPPGASSATS